MVTPAPQPNRGKDGFDDSSWSLVYEDGEFEAMEGDSSMSTSIVTYGTVLASYSSVINAAALLFILCRPLLRRNAASYLKANLFLANVVFGVFVIPVSVHTERVRAWTLGVPVCHLWLSAGVFLAALSAWTLCLVNMESAMLAFFREQYGRHVTPRRTVAGLAGAWIMSGVLLIPLLLSIFTDRDFVLEEVCATSLSPQYAIGMASVVFFCPALFIIIVNVALFFTSKRRRDATDDVTDSEKTGLKDGQAILAARAASLSVRPARTLVFVTLFNLCFLGAWLPQHVLNVRVSFCTDLCVQPALWKALVWVGYTSCGLTPTVWFLVDPGVRRELGVMVKTARRSCGLMTRDKQDRRAVEAPLTSAS